MMLPVQEGIGSMVLKIHGGTGRLTGESLCRSCSYAIIMTDYRGEHVRCGMLRDRVCGRVTECSSYENKSLPSLARMQEVAWTLRTEKNGKGIGFKPPEQSEKWR